MSFTSAPSHHRLTIAFSGKNKTSPSVEYSDLFVFNLKDIKHCDLNNLLSFFCNFPSFIYFYLVIRQTMSKNMFFMKVVFRKSPNSVTSKITVYG